MERKVIDGHLYQQFICQKLEVTVSKTLEWGEPGREIY